MVIVAIVVCNNYTVQWLCTRCNLMLRCTSRVSSRFKEITMSNQEAVTLVSSVSLFFHVIATVMAHIKATTSWTSLGKIRNPTHARRHNPYRSISTTDLHPEEPSLFNVATRYNVRKRTWMLRLGIHLRQYTTFCQSPSRPDAIQWHQSLPPLSLRGCLNSFGFRRNPVNMLGNFVKKCRFGRFTARGGEYSSL